MPIKDSSVTKKLLESKAKILDVGKFNNINIFAMWQPLELLQM